MKKFITIIAASALLTGCGVYSDGARQGTVTKLSNKGVFCKSWEGELVMGGLRGSTDTNGNRSLVANVFNFSVTESAVIEDIKAAQLSGEPVSLTYEQFLIPVICGRKTSYIITKVGS